MIAALSTADVAALICSGDPLVCAIAPLQHNAEPKPTSKKLRKKRRARSTCEVSRVIVSSRWSLTDLQQSYAPAKQRVNQARHAAHQSGSNCFRRTERPPNTRIEENQTCLRENSRSASAAVLPIPSMRSQKMRARGRMPCPKMRGNVATARDRTPSLPIRGCWKCGTALDFRAARLTCSHAPRLLRFDAATS